MFEAHNFLVAPPGWLANNLGIGRDILEDENVLAATYFRVS